VATNICFFFPTNFDENLEQNAEIFNYTCVVVGGTLIVAAFYWFLPKYGAWANFKGPRRPEDQGYEDDLEGKVAEVIQAPDVEEGGDNDGDNDGKKKNYETENRPLNQEDEFYEPADIASIDRNGEEAIQSPSTNRRLNTKNQRDADNLYDD
jgi:hypothetical protein